MPKITPLRVLFVVLLFPLSAFITFWTLPSPNYTGVQRDQHIRKVLHSGQTLTTVYTWDYTFTFADNDGNPSPFNNPATSHLAIDWRLEPCLKTNSIFLRIGGIGINLTDAVQHPSPFLGPNGGYTVRACSVAPMDAPFKLDRADEALLDNEMSNQTDSMAFVYLVSAPGEVQIWKADDGWQNFTKMSDIDEDDYHYGLLASFSNIPTSEQSTSTHRSDISQVEISELTGLLATKTFRIRKFMLRTSYPVTEVIAGIASVLYQPIFVIIIFFWLLLNLFAAYFGLVLILWLFNGRPPFLRWSRKFWLTKWWYQHFTIAHKRASKSRVWGASGPVADNSDDDADYADDLDEDEEEQRVEGVQFRPLRSPVDFFRSKAPLDDLLYTFDSTRWMIEPVRWRSRMHPASDVEADVVVVGPPETLSKTEKTKVTISL